MNFWGALIGFLIGVCIVLIAVAFFKLTWGFWSGLIDMAGMDLMKIK